MTNGNDPSQMAVVPSLAESLSTVGYGLFAFLTKGPLDTIPSLTQFIDGLRAEPDLATCEPAEAVCDPAPVDSTEGSAAAFEPTAEQTAAAAASSDPEAWASYEASLRGTLDAYTDEPSIPEAVYIAEPAVVDNPQAPAGTQAEPQPHIANPAKVDEPSEAQINALLEDIAFLDD